MKTKFYSSLSIKASEFDSSVPLTAAKEKHQPTDKTCIVLQKKRIIRPKIVAVSACRICDKKLNKNLIQEEHTCFCVGALTVCLSLAEGARPCGLNFPRATDGSAQESLSLSTFALTSCLSFILFFVVYLICLVIAGPITPD